ncbi:D-inositol-3-phosphate glycosyltransferase (EC [Olavius algarvensis Delta 1 endosymbiont]|nr:D-inositol-3-phosphate glycosyltransferase (EC [Olavius algarvensis Delta 1 endosymbiont]
MKTDPLKIAMLSIHSDPIGELGTKDTGGMSVYIRELARQLGKRGHYIDIYTRMLKSENRSITRLYENVRLIHLGIPNGGTLSKLALYRYLSKFFQALEDFRRSENQSYDLIHSHYWLSGRLGTRAQKLWDLPHVTTFHTLGEVKNQTGIDAHEPWFRVVAEKDIVQKSHRILALTNRERESLVRLYDAPPQKIGVVPCGVNLDLFYPQGKAAARHKLGLDSDDIILLYVGRFESIKGLNVLLKAMTYLDANQRLRLVVVGGDDNSTPEFRTLAQATRDWGIGEKVNFIGRVDQQNLPTYYGAADVLVLPSYSESFGMVGLEALACGRPVVTTPVGAVDRLVRRTQAGCVVPDHSAHSLADGILSIIRDPDIPSAERIRQSIFEYSWSEVASAVVAEYAELIGPQCYGDDRQIPVEASCA